jgi:hypothetical protein
LAGSAAEAPLPLFEGFALVALAAFAGVLRAFAGAAALRPPEPSPMLFANADRVAE